MANNCRQRNIFWNPIVPMFFIMFSIVNLAIQDSLEWKIAAGIVLAISLLALSWMAYSHKRQPAWQQQAPVARSPVAGDMAAVGVAAQRTTQATVQTRQSDFRVDYSHPPYSAAAHSDAPPSYEKATALPGSEPPPYE